MHRAKTIVAATTLSLLAGCGSSQGKLTIKSTAAPISSVVQPVPARIAEARGQLAIGNVASALEGFRKAARDDPTSVAAMQGIATCYDAMGRFDVSRRYYEKAFAVSPGDTELLGALARSFDQQGMTAEAASVRGEIAIRRLPAEQVAQHIGQASAASLEPPATAGSSVTIPLPHALDPKPVAAPEPAEVAHAARVGPRLERSSLGEVVLVTAAPKRWRSEVLTQSANSVTVRFVPLPKQRQETAVRLLNSARIQGLAAQTRAVLQRKGWRHVSIGDSSRVREKSLVLYSEKSEQAARDIAAQFGFGIAREARPGPLTVLLGRDTAGMRKT